MKLDFSLGNEEKELRERAREFSDLLKKGVKKSNIDADVFIGGSLAKGTLANSKDYDIDIYVRFNWKYENLSKYLEKIVKVFNRGWKIDKVHGSRDYFRIYKNKILTFEVIPVVRIKKPSDMRNVTDLSYFHVNYVKRNLFLKNEVLIAKKFCKANGVYGAESYINGFSGYGLECLIVEYKTFDKMIKELLKIKSGERLILDPAKHYKKKNDVLFEMNESRMHSPIVLVDPTWKERNALAGLNWETLKKFQAIGKKYLKNKSMKFFDKKEFDIGKFKKLKGEFLHIKLETDRQEGDIAGTKMKKFSKYLERRLDKYFDVKDREFVYNLGQKSDFYLVMNKRKEVLRLGPPIDRKKDIARFKKKNKKTFVKNGILHAREELGFSGKEFLKKYKVKDKKRMKEMGIIKMRVI